MGLYNENKANYGLNMIVANLGQKRPTMGLIYDNSQLWTEMRANSWSEIFFKLLSLLFFTGKFKYAKSSMRRFANY
jgi:hypothetical protein